MLLVPREITWTPSIEMYGGGGDNEQKCTSIVLRGALYCTCWCTRWCYILPGVLIYRNQYVALSYFSYHYIVLYVATSYSVMLYRTAHAITSYLMLLYHTRWCLVVLLMLLQHTLCCYVVHGDVMLWAVCGYIVSPMPLYCTVCCYIVSVKLVTGFHLKLARNGHHMIFSDPGAWEKQTTTRKE